MVGLNQTATSTITASYATGDANGGGGDEDHVGGLVGDNNGTITASYAIGNADGGDGTKNYVGGLVGLNQTATSTITASYATGDANGGGGDEDHVGGLVGDNNGTITASYAIGNVDGGEGTDDYVGGLIGLNQTAISYITASYGFGTLKNDDIAGIDDSGNRPNGVLGVSSGPNGARFLTADNTFGAWNSATRNSRYAWNFGTNTEIPTLHYADYDDAGKTYGCGSDSTNIIVIPDRVPAPAGSPGGVIDVACDGTTPLPGQTPEVDTALLIDPVDTDNDYLIEISSLEQLYNMRYNLAGTSYKTSRGDSGVMCGTTLNADCKGYELTRSLTFDRDGGGTYNRATYALDAGDHHATYFSVTGSGTGGWSPIGNATTPFSTTFEGNGFYIRGLAVRRNTTYVGMFGRTDNRAVIRNIRLTNNLADYTGNSSSIIYVGGLVAYNEGTISASHAGGDADGGAGGGDYVGGLIGLNSGDIIASYATGDADGGSGTNNLIGGLAGQNNGTIIASYATGDADGGNGIDDHVGGLVGRNARSGTIIASYATGDANGGNGIRNYVGGLVGFNVEGTITASYATGDADGGNDDRDYVGGLVGQNNNGDFNMAATITASYATGDANGGDGVLDRVGGLVGLNTEDITASYGFGSSMNVDTAGVDDSGDRHPNWRFAVGSGINGARAFLVPGINSFRAAPMTWNNARDNTENAWSFGATTDTQAPALRYADYDGDDGTTYGCGSKSTATIVIPNEVPAPGVPGGVMKVECGETLLGGPQPR